METQKEELIRFTSAWDEAMVRNDPDEISGFMSDDWTIVGSEGITTKISFIESVRSGALTHSRMDSDEMDVKCYGNTGIVVSRGTSAGKFLGESFHLYEWSTSVYIKNEGRWRCVSTMLTPAIARQVK